MKSQMTMKMVTTKSIRSIVPVLGFTAISIAFFVIGCNTEGRTINASSNRRMSNHEAVTVLKDTTFGGLNRQNDVMVFPPYTPDSVVQQQLAPYDGTAGIHSSIASNDGVNLVVRIDLDEMSVRGWCDLPRSDFSVNFNGSFVIRGRFGEQ